MIAPGAILAGKYRVERLLGNGGMGWVVQATHLHLQQPVAMKFLHAESLAEPEVVQRFLREAQASVRLRSEHVARVLDVGTLDNQVPYMVLEYLNGSDLAQLRRDQLDIGKVVDLMMQACDALAEAHSIGIVHRDIKPANFFITNGADGELHLKILDFGISKQSNTTDGNLTATSTVMGTPAYMSPEQMRSSRDVDARSDIWSLGIVMYELFEGRQPFQGDTFTAMVLRVANDPLPPLTAQLPPALASIVYRCLEKDPARRFGNVGELAAALAPFARLQAQASISVQRINRALGSASFPVLHQQATSANPSTLSRSSGQFGGAVTVPNRRSSKTGVIVGVSALAVVVIALVAFAVTQGRKQTPKAATMPVEPTLPTPTAVPPPPPTAAAVVPPEAAPLAAPPDAAAPVAAPPDAVEPPPPLPDAAPEVPRRKKKTPTSDDLMDQRT